MSLRKLQRNCTLFLFSPFNEPAVYTSFFSGLGKLHDTYLSKGPDILVLFSFFFRDFCLIQLCLVYLFPINVLLWVDYSD